MYFRFPILLKSFLSVIPGSPRLMAGLLVIPLLFSACIEKSFPKSGETAPSISCNDVNGDYFSLYKLKGNVVIIYFWSSSCCGARLKKLEPWFRLNKYKGLSILAVNVGDGEERVRSYATDNGLTFSMLADENRMISRQYGVVGFPTIFILDGDGIIRHKILGEIEEDHLFKLASRLLL